jgi:hypothetical protein
VLQQEFGQRVKAIGRILPMLEPYVLSLAFPVILLNSIISTTASCYFYAYNYRYNKSFLASQLFRSFPLQPQQLCATSRSSTLLQQLPTSSPSLTSFE